jgi:hypothetical protein
LGVELIKVPTVDHVPNLALPRLEAKEKVELSVVEPEVGLEAHLQLLIMTDWLFGKLE